MAKPYANELEKLPATFQWASRIDITRVKEAVRSAASLPLQAIGSGGSLTAAHALVALHQEYCGRLAAVTTPLEAADVRLGGSSHWLLSAGGSNVDILAAAKTLISREPQQISVLCGRSDSPLGEVCSRHTFVDFLELPPPAGKDGFLATNSLLGFIAVLARAYAEQFGDDADWTETETQIADLLKPNARAIAEWKRETEKLWSRGTTLLIHGPITKVGAIDLESKFSEAALGNLHLADFRNFAHGRHHWLAKRGGVSAVLAILTDEDEALGDRTLSLIPDDIPVARIRLPGSRLTAMLASLVVAFHVTQWAGRSVGIDPGQPGVPEFGRKLYNLPLPRRKATKAAVAITSREAIAIARKAGKFPEDMSPDELASWKNAYHAFSKNLSKQRFDAIVFDYDGTIVNTRDRFSPPCKAVAQELERLLDANIAVAIATGRGKSIRSDMQAALDKRFWDRVLIGYYNGAEIAPLSDAGAPCSEDVCADNLLSLAAALKDHPELSRLARQTNRRSQITLESTTAMPEGRLWDIAHQVIERNDHTHLVNVSRSSHSVDIFPKAVSKLRVVERVTQEFGASAILAIGDRGRWPGNDFELLQLPCAISVDETSIDPATCWNMAAVGHKGLQATLAYLSSLDASEGVARFRTGAFR